MAHDVTQWLAEIRSLQHQLAMARQERDQAYRSAANWQRIYEKEAEQRRSAALDREMPPPASAVEPDALVGIGDLQHQLQIQRLMDRCATLEAALETERLAHAHTRQTLTTALGETFETLKPDFRGVSASAATSPPQGQQRPQGEGETSKLP